MPHQMEKKNNQTAQPLQPDKRKYWLGICTVVIALTLFFSFTPFQLACTPTQYPLLSPLLDKGKHFAAFLTISLFLLNFYRKFSSRLIMLALLSLGGLAIEIGQGLCGYRTCDMYDMLANLCGITCAVLLVVLIGRYPTLLLKASQDRTTGN